VRVPRVVVPAPLLDQHLGLLHCVEDLAVQEFVAQLSVEALDVSVLPRALWLDLRRMYADLAKPPVHDGRDEL
jgi:hypothetical protein